MNSQEAAVLCRYVSALCPAQKIDEYSADAWFDMLGDLPLPIAKLAAVEVAKRQPFVAPADIHTMVGRMRRAVTPHVRAAVETVEGQYPANLDGPWPVWLRWRNRRIAGLVDGALATGLVHFGDDIRESLTTVDTGQLPLKAIEAKPVVVHGDVLGELGLTAKGEIV